MPMKIVTLFNRRNKFDKKAEIGFVIYKVVKSVSLAGKKTGLGENIGVIINSNIKSNKKYRHLEKRKSLQEVRCSG